MREAYTAVIARGEAWSGTVETEPYEAGWAGEAIVFVHALEASGAGGAGELTTLISPDGIRWVEEGTRGALPAAAGGTTFAKISHFGHFLRFRATLPAGRTLKVVVTLALKE
jgi:hypothetical protein